MALDCLLIETLLQFKFGYEETTGVNSVTYSNFLSCEFHDIFNSKKRLRDSILMFVAGFCIQRKPKVRRA